MPAKKRTLKGDKIAAPGSLSNQIELGERVASTEWTKKLKSRHDDVPDTANQYVDPVLSRKVLSIAREQQQEELGILGNASVEKRSKSSRPVSTSLTDDIDIRSDSNSEDASEEGFDYDYEPPEIGPEEEQAFEKYMCSDPAQRRNLADIIQEKLAEKRAGAMSVLSTDSCHVCELDPRLLDMYKGVGEVLSTYRSGRLPKSFKIIPKLRNWEQILSLTKPEEWTAASMFQATRIFASNLNAKLCQRFYNLVLLPRIRDDITEYKKLNPHLYQALRKALFKPAAFFKGILLPLCESRSATLREATIIGSILARCSIPMLHAAAAMIKIAEMEYTGANSIFLRVLIDKKYTLPYRVIDALVFHFLRFATDQRQMTVLWHQCLLAFIQKFKEDISSEQKVALLELLKVHVHHQMTPTIRHELQNSKCRDAETCERDEIMDNS